MDIGNIVKKYRKQSNITQDELAKKIGISKSFMSKIEIGNKQPSFEIKLKLCEILNIPFKELGINNIPGLYVVPRPDINDIFPGPEKLKEEPKAHDPVEEFKFMANNVLLDEEKEMMFKLIEHYNYAYCNGRYDLSKINDDTYMDLRNMFYISMKTILKNYQK